MKRFGEKRNRLRSLKRTCELVTSETQPWPLLLRDLNLWDLIRTVRSPDERRNHCPVVEKVEAGSIDLWLCLE